MEHPIDRVGPGRGCAAVHSVTLRLSVARWHPAYWSRQRLDGSPRHVGTSLFPASDGGLCEQGVVLSGGSIPYARSRAWREVSANASATASMCCTRFLTDEDAPPAPGAGCNDRWISLVPNGRMQPVSTLQIRKPCRCARAGDATPRATLQAMGVATGEICRTSLHHHKRIEATLGWGKGAVCLAASVITTAQAPRRPGAPSREVGRVLQGTPNPCLFTRCPACIGWAERKVSTSCVTPRFFNRLSRAMTLRQRPCPCIRRSTSRTTLPYGSCPNSSMRIGFGESIVGSSGSRRATPAGCAFVSSATAFPGSPSSAMGWNGTLTNSFRRATLRSRSSAASRSSCFDTLRTAVCRACGQ